MTLHDKHFLLHLNSDLFFLLLQFMNQTRQGMGMKMENMGGNPGMRPGMQPGMGGQVDDRKINRLLAQILTWSSPPIILFVSKL